MSVPGPKVRWWQRIIQRITSMRWAARFMTRRLHRWDNWVHKMSSGRWTASELLTGLPVLFLTTLGAKSNEPHTTPLLAIADGEGLLLIATKFGSDHHPDWYYNLRKNPQVEVLFRGVTSSYRADLLTGAVRERAWQKAIDHYPGYQSYKERATKRVIPVVRLSLNR